MHGDLTKDSASVGEIPPSKGERLVTRYGLFLALLMQCGCVGARSGDIQHVQSRDLCERVEGVLRVTERGHRPDCFSPEWLRAVQRQVERRNLSIKKDLTAGSEALCQYVVEIVTMLGAEADTPTERGR